MLGELPGVGDRMFKCITVTTLDITSGEHLHDRGNRRAAQAKAGVHVAGGDASCGVMDHRRGFTDVPGAATYLLLAA